MQGFAKRAAVLVAVCLILAPASASAWAPAKSASIRPGAQTLTDGRAFCTSNFVFTSGAAVYLGQAAHCASRGGATDIDGCRTRSLPLGTAVTIRGASRPGRLVYSSWLSMQARGERDRAACRYNDFALVAVDGADVGRVNPTVPGFGGPTGVGSAAVGSAVFGYGNSPLRLGLRLLNPRQGAVLASVGGGWGRLVYTLTPGIPGDSGSGLLDGSGRAVGVLSTLSLLPLPGSNGIGNLPRELDWMRAAEPNLAGVNLAGGSEPFRANLVAAVLRSL